MPRELRRLAIVAGFALAAVVAALTAQDVAGRRWEAARPSVVGPDDAASAPSAPIGRRWY